MVTIGSINSVLHASVMAIAHNLDAFKSTDKILVYVLFDIHRFVNIYICLYSAL